MPRDYTVGIDIGGTFIKAGLCDDQLAVVAREAVDTVADRGPEDAFQRIAAQIDALVRAAGVDRAAVRAIGVGVPGPLSHARGVILNAPNLPGWSGAPIRDRLSALAKLPVIVENDAKAAAFGEFTQGAGGGMRDMVMLTLGTGVGGGIVLGGKLWRGSFDNAGEIGHTIVEPGGRPCPCGQNGCLERYASASAVALRTIEAIGAGETSSLQGLAGQGRTIDAADVQQAAREGDALASRIWDETCRYLAVVCVNLQHMLNPQLIVLGGGLIQAGSHLLEPVRRHFDTYTWSMAPDSPRIELATLGGDAGILGAAALARGL